MHAGCSGQRLVPRLGLAMEDDATVPGSLDKQPSLLANDGAAACDTKHKQLSRKVRVGASTKDALLHRRGGDSRAERRSLVL